MYSWSTTSTVSSVGVSVDVVSPSPSKARLALSKAFASTLEQLARANAANAANGNNIFFILQFSYTLLTPRYCFLFEKNEYF